MIRAYCYASGLIEFGRDIPKGATVIARGPEPLLRAFITAKARRDYGSHAVRGRRVRIPGPGRLLVPGVPEADNQIAAINARKRWAEWIAIGAPKGVRVLS